MSINQLFELSRRSFRTYDAAMQTTSDNISNAGVEGYHRRRITRSADSASSPGVTIKAPFGGVVGTGVSVQSYERMRDALMEHSGWQAQGNLGSAEEEARLLSAVEGIFATGSDGNLSGVLGQFFDAWGDVADNPTDLGVRNTLLSHAETLTYTFNRLSADLDSFAEETQLALSDNVDQVNSLLTSIAESNATIREAQFNGSPDLAAEDQRDKQVKELAKLIPLRVQDSDKGYTVTMNGMTLVQDDTAEQLEMFKKGGEALPTHVRLAGTGHELRAPTEGGGELGAQLRTLHETLPELGGELDALAEQLVTDVNNLHEGGFGLDGVDGRSFFDPANLTAGAIALSGDVDTPAKIAAAGPNGGVFPGAGDSTQARDLAGLRETFSPRSIDLMADVGARAGKASSQATARQAVTDHLDGLAAGVSGVSLDEEMTNLIQHQQAFQASARVLNTAQTMMDTLLAM